MASIALRVRPRAPAKVDYHTLALAVLIIFPVIALEQYQHTSPAVLLALPLYEGLHWLSDALMALPLGVAAVWGGETLADHFRIRFASTSDIFARACIIAMVLALLLIPGGSLHDAADSLTHSHAVLGIHSHAPVAPNATGLQAFVNNLLHNFTDGLEGQLVGLPLAFVGLLWAKRWYRQPARRTSGSIEGGEIRV